ncbi:hypothetical protein ACWF0M_12230 [Kribbella sp. NPDC055110]
MAKTWTTPQGLDPGADAALRLTITNESAATADTLAASEIPTSPPSGTTQIEGLASRPARG